MLLINCRSADAAQSTSAAIAHAPVLVERITLTLVQPEIDGNIQRRYEIEKAAWVWHPAMPQGAEAVLLFRNEFTVTAGFQEVEIAPAPDNLASLDVPVPHPNGWIEGRLQFDHQRKKCSGTITLPEDVNGVFRWAGRQIKLIPDKTTEIR